MMKGCSKCGQEKRPSEMALDSRRPDGFSSHCRVCVVTAQRERRRREPEKAQAAERDWRLANPGRWAEIKRASDRKSYQRCRERRRNAQAEAYRRDPEPYKMRARQRKAKQRAQAREYVDPLVVLERDDGVCGICGEDVDPFAFEVDHIVPVSRGGEHAYDNVQSAHVTCNRRKADHLFYEVA